jgi:hypothetical protein
MSKKTLNESTVRRFMGLANIQPTVVSSYMKENYMNEEEPELEDDAPVGMDAAPEEEPMDDAPEELPMDDAPEEEGMDMDGVDITPEEAQLLIDLGQKLAAAMPAPEEEEEEEEMGMDAEAGMEAPPEEGGEEMDAMPMGDEEEMLESALKGVSIERSEQEVVQEVARRVAHRILKAKKAQSQLNKALGKN